MRSISGDEIRPPAQRPAPRAALSSAELLARSEGLAAALAGADPPEAAEECMAEAERLGRILDLLEAALSARVRRV